MNPSGDVFARSAEAGQLEVVDQSGPVQTKVRDPSLPDQIDEEPRQAELDRMGPHHEHDRPIGLPRGDDLPDELFPLGMLVSHGGRRQRQARVGHQVVPPIGQRAKFHLAPVESFVARFCFHGQILAETRPEAKGEMFKVQCSMFNERWRNGRPH